MDTDHTDGKPYVLASPAQVHVYQAVLIGGDPPVKGSIACAVRMPHRTADLPSKRALRGFEHSRRMSLRHCSLQQRPLLQHGRHAKTKAEAMRAILAELARPAHAS